MEAQQKRRAKVVAAAIPGKIDDEEVQQEEGEDASKMGGLQQGRGGDASGEKCRVTFELRQGLSGYFGRDPTRLKSDILPSILVLKGAYAQLSNITDDHRFKEDLQFEVGGEKRLTKRGNP